MKLKEGDIATDFALKDKDAILHSLKNINSDFVVVYFYPKDNTPGCTVEAQMFSKEFPSFVKLNTVVLGISGGNEASKAKFCNAHKLRILLLSDTDLKVAKAYGAHGQKLFMGRKYFGITRTTFVLDKNHKILKIFDKVKPDTHAQEVLKFIEGVKK